MEIERDKPAVEPGPRYVPWRWTVAGSVFFTVVFLVGEPLTSVVAWPLGLALFVLLCFALFAFVRWLLRLPDENIVDD